MRFDLIPRGALKIALRPGGFDLDGCRRIRGTSAQGFGKEAITVIPAMGGGKSIGGLQEEPSGGRVGGGGCGVTPSFGGLGGFAVF